MNVALTRARFSLLIVCNAATLQGSAPWAALLQNAKERGVLHTVKSPYRGFFDRDRSVELRKDRGGAYQKGLSPKDPVRTSPPIDVVAPKTEREPYKSLKSRENLEKSLSSFVMGEFREDRNDGKDEVIIEDEGKTNHREIKYRESRRSNSSSVKKGCEESMVFDKRLVDTSNKLHRNNPLLGSSDEMTSADSTVRKTRDFTVPHIVFEPFDSTEGAGLREDAKLCGPQKSGFNGKTQTDDRTNRPLEALDCDIAQCPDSQTRKAAEGTQSARCNSIGKPRASRGASFSESEGKTGVLNEARVEMTANLQGSYTSSHAAAVAERFRASNVVEGVSVDGRKRKPSELGIKRLSTGEGVAGDEIIRSPSEVTGANDAQRKSKMNRPFKRHRLDKPAGSSLRSNDLQTTLPKFKVHKKEHAVKNFAEHCSDISKEESADNQWDRFVRILDEIKSRFPLPKG